MNIFFYIFLKGLVFGITMAAIPGPIFFLIVQRTLAEGLLTGLFCGLGAVTADTFYASIAGIGLSWVLQFLLDYKILITLFGALFLMYLGVTTYRKKPTFKAIVISEKGLLSAWLSTFLLTLTNPVTILSYCIIFAGLGIDTQEHTGAFGALVSGVIIGALSVLIVLISVLSLFRLKLSTSSLNIINKSAGIILICFGIVALLKSIVS